MGKAEREKGALGAVEHGPVMESWYENGTF